MESGVRVRYQPKFGRVLIQREIEEKTKGGLYLPENMKQKLAACEGIIVGLGETAGWTDTYNDSGEILPKQTLKIGDKVLFGRHSGAWLDATTTEKGAVNDDGKLFICQDADILCVINGEENE